MSSTPINHLASSVSVHGRHDALPTDESFLRALTGNDHSPKQDNNVAIYIHPLVKKSSAKLSDKSLEMCTESLGSETGSDDILEEKINIIDSCSSTVHSSKTCTKAKRGEYNFPPPLSSIDESVSMKLYRENGRLVMNAVAVTERFDSSLFIAERIDGRLKLQLKKGDWGGRVWNRWWVWWKTLWRRNRGLCFLTWGQKWKY